MMYDDLSTFIVKHLTMEILKIEDAAAAPFPLCMYLLLIHDLVQHAQRKELAFVQNKENKNFNKTFQVL